MSRLIAGILLVIFFLPSCITESDENSQNQTVSPLYFNMYLVTFEKVPSRAEDFPKFSLEPLDPSDLHAVAEEGTMEVSIARAPNGISAARIELPTPRYFLDDSIHSRILLKHGWKLEITRPRGWEYYFAPIYKESRLIPTVNLVEPKNIPPREYDGYWTWPADIDDKLVLEIKPNPIPDNNPTHFDHH